MSSTELPCATNVSALTSAWPLESSLSASVDVAQALERTNRVKVLWLSFTGFTLSFAAWLMFGVLGIPIQREFQFDDVSLAWLSAIAILNGAVWRLPFGMLADRLGGKRTLIGLLLFASLSSFLVAFAQSYGQLLFFAFLVGLGGNSFSVGSAWNAAWFPPQQQGFAMGLFGAGNVGASITKLIGPTLIALVPAAGVLGGWIPGGWRFVPFLYGILLLLMAVAVAAMAPAVDKMPGAGRSLKSMLSPLRDIRVWRFSLYYTVVFGAYVAMSAWLPKYFVSVYNLPLSKAALLTTPFIFASSLLRPLGGWLSDRFGPRKVTYGVFLCGGLMSLLLLLPLDVTTFTLCVTLLGITQGFGKASTIKYVPEYYPNDVGVVVGLVGSLAALGGFVMPPLFAYLQEWTGWPQSMFGVIFGITAISLIWLHCVVLRIRRQEQQNAPQTI
jgi:NNP family nitrate/nitrite transporter-like MFS transporter